MSIDLPILFVVVMEVTSGKASLTNNLANVQLTKMNRKGECYDRA